MQLAQWYHKPVLSLLLHVDTGVRKAALDVMANMLRRGIVMPMVVVPYLAALAGVDSSEVAPRAVQALAGIAKRHPEFLQSRTADSIPLAFRLQRTLYAANPQHVPHNTGTSRREPPAAGARSSRALTQRAPSVWPRRGHPP